MVIISGESFSSIDSSSTSKSVSSGITKESDSFLKKKVPNDEKEMKLVPGVSTPEPFEDYGATDIQSLSIKYDSDTNDTTDIIIEDTIVEYKTCAGREQTFRDHKITYLKTYVSVGIPNDRYKWIFKKMTELSGKKVSWTPKCLKDEYTWVSARIPPESHVYEEAYCCVYNNDENETKSIGTVTDVVTQLKSNVIGYGQFTIRVVKNFHGAFVLSFLLTGFQMMDLTSKQSKVEPFIVNEPSAKLLGALKKLNIA